MKLLKVDGASGFFLDDKKNYKDIEKITKEDLLRLVNMTLHEDKVEFDEYDEKVVKNLAQQVIYKNVFQKLMALKGRRKEFLDESERLFLTDYEKYKNELK